MTAAALARMLKPFEILPATKREGSDSFKGYYYSDFKEAFDCYLPDQTVTMSQSNNDGHCDGVTVSNGKGASSQHKCDHCKQYGATIEVAYDGAGAWLHRGCMNAWRTAYDDLDIRNQPFYRSQQ